MPPSVDDLRASIGPLLPSAVDQVHATSGSFVLHGRGWQFRASCPWRVTRGGGFRSAADEDGAADDVRQLATATLLEVELRPGVGGPDDPVLRFDDGTRVELFVETHLDPWVARFADITVVGDAAVRPGAGWNEPAEPLADGLRDALPGRIDCITWDADVLTVSTGVLTLQARCPWRLARAGELVVAWADHEARSVLAGLAGREWRAVNRRPGRGGADDPVLVIDDGTTLELFADADPPPWALTPAPPLKRP